MIMIENDHDHIQLSPLGRPGLRERNKRDKRERITRAAAELFRRHGFEATTAREICRRAGIGTGTLFNYVRDKRELLFLIFREEAQRLLEGSPPRLAPGQAVPEALLALLTPFIDLYARDPGLSALYVRELFFRRPEETRGMAELDRQLRDRVSGVFREARARGDLRADLDLPLATAAALAHYGFWIQGWLGMGLVPREAVEPGLRSAFTLMLEGMLPSRVAKIDEEGAT